jgi:predicted nucleic-acid-binding Zn-ribbon protein
VKNGKCPKCGSDNVFHGAEIPAKFGPFGSNSIPITLLSMASLDNYVCAECGYVESYVAESMKRVEISKKWPKVKAEASS